MCMCLIFPEAQPKTRKEVMDFVAANFIYLKEMYIRSQLYRIENMELQEIRERMMSGGKEYGTFKLHSIDTKQEMEDENRDGFLYFAMDLLQCRFPLENEQG